MKKLTRDEALKRMGDRHPHLNFTRFEFTSPVSKSDVVCNDHGLFLSSYQELMRSTGCPTCWQCQRGGRYAVSEAEFIQRSAATHNGFYGYESCGYKGVAREVAITCPKHGVFRQLAGLHMNGRGCRRCWAENLTPSNTLTHAEYIARVSPLQAEYDLSNVTYTALKNKIDVVCKKHGVFRPTADNFLNRQSKCPKCKAEVTSARSRLSRDVFIARFREIHSDRFTYGDFDYSGRHTLIEVICEKHGKFKVNAQDHASGIGCAKCSKPLYDLTSFITEARHVHGEKYNYDNVEFSNSSEKATFNCPKHGDFEQAPVYHVHQGHGCPQCGSVGPSKGQLEVHSFLSQYTEVVLEHPIGGRKRLDVFLPKFNLAVEFHGLIWHSTMYSKHPLNLHQRHVDAAKNGIRVIHVFQDEWEQRRGAVEGILRSAIGASTKRYARSGTVRALNDAEARKFIDATHVQGSAAGCIHYGLLIDGQVTAAMSFSKNTSIREHKVAYGVWELTRYCSSETVVGGASRLFKAFLRDHRPCRVISYSDIRMFTGGMYKALGFAVENVSEPSYTYVRSGALKRFSKSRFQRRFLPKLLGESFDPSLSEASNCAKAGWFQLFDCGKIRWAWSRP